MGASVYSIVATGALSIIFGSASIGRAEGTAISPGQATTQTSPLPLLSKRVAVELRLDLSTPRHVVVTGRTNLPDGTSLDLWVEADGEWSGYQSKERVTVRNGAFRGGPFGASGGMLPGPFVARILLHPRAQSESVAAIIGDRGQKLRGPLVLALSGDNIVETKKYFRVPGQGTPGTLPATSRSASVPPRDEIGAWQDNQANFASRITIYRKAGGLFMENRFSDGSVLTTEMVERTSSRGRRFEDKVDRKNGQYYVINRQGNLEVWDPDGLFVTASRVR
jgi:hypothetical protein